MIFQLGAVVNPLGEDRGLFASNGLIGLMNSIMLLVITAAGIFALFNFITAGMKYISSQGDPKAITDAQQKIVMSILGLVIIAASFMMAAVAGLLIFGHPLAFIRPKIFGPGAEINFE